MALVLLSAGGCAGNGDGLINLRALSGADRAVFRCDDDRSFRVNYNDGGDEALVDAGDVNYQLELRDHDGNRRVYEGDDATLTVDRDEARLRISGASDYDDCEKS